MKNIVNKVEYLKSSAIKIEIYRKIRENENSLKIFETPSWVIFTTINEYNIQVWLIVNQVERTEEDGIREKVKMPIGSFAWKIDSTKR